MLLAVALGILGAAGLAAQEQDAPKIFPVGSARLSFEGRSIAVPYTLIPQGPLFSLAPIAGFLQLDLRIGPMGESHRLVFPDREVIVGPKSPVVVSLTPDGERQLSPLSSTPRKSASGLQVPMDFLRLTLGDAMGYEVDWNPTSLEIAVARRTSRVLQAAVNRVHQFRVTTLEIQFSEEPRFKVERSPGRLAIRLLGDRLSLPVSQSGGEDPFIRRIEARADGLFIELQPDIVAAEPRLQSAPSPRLVIEVFRQLAGGPADVPTVSSGLRRPPTRRQGVRTIVLDPGHGGSETGAIGRSGSAEKDLVLLIARALKRQLERRMAVRVVLTRNEDLELSHESRTALANQNQADLFISLHLNSSFGSQAHGAETYFLSREASDQMAADAAVAENRQQGSSGDLQWILWDLAQNHHLAESQRFAKLVQEELNETLELRNRGVKQAPFRVLIGDNMPAVLVELGFLSNPDEEQKLESAAYRNRLVESLARAVLRFKRQAEGMDSEDSAPKEAGSPVPGQ